MYECDANNSDADYTGWGEKKVASIIFCSFLGIGLELQSEILETYVVIIYVYISVLTEFNYLILIILKLSALQRCHLATTMHVF